MADSYTTITSDLYLKLATPQRDYWFTFSVSNGYGGISALPVTDPYVDPGSSELVGEPFGTNLDGASAEEIGGRLRFMSMDEGLAVAFDPLMRGDDALPYVMLPELGRSFTGV